MGFSKANNSMRTVILAPKGRGFTQPRATPWERGATEPSLIQTTAWAVQRTNGSRPAALNRWPVGPNRNRHCSRLPRTLPWAGGTSGLRPALGTITNHHIEAR